MNLQMIMLSERRQKKNTYQVILFNKTIENANGSIVTESRSVGAWGWERLEGGGRETTKGHKETFGGNGYVHYVDHGDVYTCVKT